MPSSISSSDLAAADLATMAADGPPLAERFDRPGFVRQTAADRPGVAQPVPERDVPPQPWGRILIGAGLLFLVLLTLWELRWREFGATPGYRNSNGAWAEQRRRIDRGEGGKTVLVGSSRVLFDVQLDQWQAATGERPIQLALEGTTPVPVLEDLAADPDFRGRLVVGVAPDLFFSGFAYRGAAIRHYHEQGPSQRSGHWLSKRLLEPYFAFYDPDFALPAVLERQTWWPPRPGLRREFDVRKLMEQHADRDTHIWAKVETDIAYRDLCRSIWSQHFTGPPPPPFRTAEGRAQLFGAQIERAAKAVATLRARGVPVVFVRPPSDGDYYAFESKVMPRAQTWDLLLRRTGAPGVHFEDHAQLQGLELPEWSHLTRADARRYTTALAPLVQREFERQRAGSAQVATTAR
jgi:hypothetical protein